MVICVLMQLEMASILSNRPVDLFWCRYLPVYEIEWLWNDPIDTYLSLLQMQHKQVNGFFTQS